MTKLLKETKVKIFCNVSRCLEFGSKDSSLFFDFQWLVRLSFFDGLECTCLLGGTSRKKFREFFLRRGIQLANRVRG